MIIVDTRFSARTNQHLSWLASWGALQSGATAFSAPDRFDSSLSGGPPLGRIAEWGALSPESRFAFALRSVVEGLPPSPDPARTALLVATSHGNGGAVSAAVASLGKNPPLSSDAARWARALIVTSPADELRRETSSFALAATLTAACASAVSSLAAAEDLLESGECDYCVVAAIDLLPPVAYAAFRQMRAMSPDGCAPFMRAANGVTVSEGAAACLLSRTQAAPLRGATVVLRATAMNCVSDHQIQPSPRGLKAVIADALDRAGLKPSDIALIVWHGTGTAQNDATEAEVCRTMFGDAPPCSTGTKRAFGHTMGASAMLSLFAAASALLSRQAPPICADGQIAYPRMNFTVGRSQPLRPGAALVVAAGFGGINGAAIVSLVENTSLLSS